jgi:hypothetical protein
MKRVRLHKVNLTNLRVSRINHSCKPNVRHLWDEKLKVHHIRTTVDIPANTEICTSYIPLFEKGHERQRTLMKEWNFKCSCEACADNSSDGRRLKIAQLDNQIAAEATHYPREAMQHVQLRLDLMAEEGVFDEMGRTCMDGFQICVAWGDEANAKQWIRTSMKWDTILTGNIDKDKSVWLFNPQAHPDFRAALRQGDTEQALNHPGPTMTIGATFSKPNAYISA